MAPPFLRKVNQSEIAGLASLLAAWVRENRRSLEGCHNAEEQQGDENGKREHVESREKQRAAWPAARK